VKTKELSVLVLALALLLGCGKEEAVVVASAPPVMVVPVELREIVDRIEATGQLLAKAEARVAAQVGGQITAIHVEEGTRVEAGEILIEIDPERRNLEVASQLAMVAESEAQLVKAKREAGRISTLRSRGASSDAQADEAQTALKLAAARAEASRAQLGLAQRALADSSIRAPFSGQISKRMVNEGEFVAPGQTLIELVSLDNIEVEFHLAERDSSRVSDGVVVDVRVAPFPDEVFSAKVMMVSPTIDARTRTLRVKAAVADPHGRLKPGLFARADLGLRHRSGVIMIPEEAMMLRSDGTVVFRLGENGQAERVVVEVGVHDDGWIEIVEGLAPTDVVVVRGQTRLIDGSVVAVRTADGKVPTPSEAATQASR